MIREGHTAKRYRRVTYPESYITKYAPYKKRERSSERRTRKKSLKHLPNFWYQPFASPEKEEEDEQDQVEKEGAEPAPQFRLSLISRRERHTEEEKEGDGNTDTTQISPIIHFPACE